MNINHLWWQDADRQLLWLMPQAELNNDILRVNQAQIEANESAAAISDDSAPQISRNVSKNITSSGK